MSDIVEQLKEPESHYPGNFDTPKRANAMLSCLCQEAAETIEFSTMTNSFAGAPILQRWLA